MTVENFLHIGAVVIVSDDDDDYCRLVPGITQYMAERTEGAACCVHKITQDMVGRMACRLSILACIFIRVVVWLYGTFGWAAPDLQV